MGIGYILVLVLGGIMLALGIWSSRFIKTGDDYFVAGRSLGPLVTICTQCATFVGGGMTLGWIGLGYKQGLGGAWYGLPQCLGMFFMAIFLAKEMREWGEFVSLPDWFDNIFHDNTLRFITALVCIITPMTWICGQTTAAARMLEAVGIPYVTGVLLVGGIVIAYSTMGGLLAVVYTDTMQWLLLGLLFLLTTPIAFIMAGGLSGIVANTPAFMHQPMHVEGMPPYTIPLWLISGLVAGMGLQTTYQRIFSARDTKTAKMGLWSTGIATIFFAIYTAVVGMAIYSLGAPADLAQDKVWPWFLNNHLPSWVGVVYTVLVLMATMSTADSMLNSISLSITHDIYKKLINPNATEKQIVRLGMIVTVVLGTISLYWATAGTWMVKIFGLSYTLGAGPLAAAVIATTFYKRRLNSRVLSIALIAGATVGAITTKVPGLSSIPAGGVVFSFSTCFLISLLGMAVNKRQTLADQTSTSLK